MPEDKSVRCVHCAGGAKGDRKIRVVGITAGAWNGQNNNDNTILGVTQSIQRMFCIRAVITFTRLAPSRSSPFGLSLSRFTRITTFLSFSCSKIGSVISRATRMGRSARAAGTALMHSRMCTKLIAQLDGIPEYIGLVAE